MYGWFFRHLPGPTWFRVFLCLVIAAFAVAVLFAYVPPWPEVFVGWGGAGAGVTQLAHCWGGGLGRPPQRIQFSLSALRARSPPSRLIVSPRRASVP